MCYCRKGNLIQPHPSTNHDWELRDADSSLTGYWLSSTKGTQQGVCVCERVAKTTKEKEAVGLRVIGEVGGSKGKWGKM